MAGSPVTGGDVALYAIRFLLLCLGTACPYGTSDIRPFQASVKILSNNNEVVGGFYILLLCM